MSHPLAFPGNKSGGVGADGNTIRAGQLMIHLPDYRNCTLDECLSDGDAFVTWEDGSYGTVKWKSLFAKDPT